MSVEHLLGEPISPRDFMLFFTEEERATLHDAATQNGTILRFLMDICREKLVSLDSPMIHNGLAALMTAKIINEQRRDMILRGERPS